MYGLHEAFCVKPILLHGVEVQYDLLYLRGFLYSFSRMYSCSISLIKFFIIINTMEKEKKGCTSCKQGGKEKLGWMMVLGTYLFITSIYGNVILIDKLITYLKTLF